MYQDTQHASVIFCYIDITTSTNLYKLYKIKINTRYATI